MNEEELDQWESKSGFKSLRTLISNANDEFGELKTQAEFIKWKTKHQDIVTMLDSTVTPLIDIGHYKTIVNRNQMYWVGKSLHKIYPDKLVIIEDGDSEKLVYAESLYENDSIRGIYIIDYRINKTIQFRDGGDENCERLKHDSYYQVGDRKAFLSIKAYTAPDGLLRYTKTEIRVAGHKKSWGGWHDYKTNLYARNIAFSVTDAEEKDFIFEWNRGYQSNSKQLVKYNDLDAYEIYYEFDNSKVKINWSVGRGTTGGTGTMWATLCCNNPPRPYNSCPTTYNFWD
ncbi:hypothetical protein [Membranihabitans marinus]|uniref:hypothetical protein n=1 Tax=Membranihabitans marinus TaxID=1227546 RepID=UPI001F24DDE5|nr:hypothetical protein [Membranihabitans marinus]